MGSKLRTWDFRDYHITITSVVILLVGFARLSGATSGNELFDGFVFPSQSYKLAVFNCCCSMSCDYPCLHTWKDHPNNPLEIHKMQF